MSHTFRRIRDLLVASLAAGVSIATAQITAITGSAVSVDLSGVITVLDNHSSTLRQYAPDGTRLREIGGQGWGNDQFDRPAGVWAKNGIDVFVADFGNHRIQRFDNALAFVSTLFTRDNNDPAKRFGYPTGVTLSRLGDLFICDGENNRIAKVGSTNQVELTFGGFGAGSGRLTHPLQLDCGPNDDVYVLDPPHIVIFDAFGNYVGELAPGMFRDPIALSADQSHILVVDTVGMYVFDDRQQMVGHAPLPVSSQSGEISGCAVTAHTIYLIGAAGLGVYPLEGLLDKERNSH